LIYLGFALAGAGWQVWTLYTLYGVYYGLSYGTIKALVADMVQPAQRGTAYGVYNAALGVLDFPASLIAGILWQGVEDWRGLGPLSALRLRSNTGLYGGLVDGPMAPSVATNGGGREHLEEAFSGRQSAISQLGACPERTSERHLVYPRLRADR